jgi:hypothetical protein
LDDTGSGVPALTLSVVLNEAPFGSPGSTRVTTPNWTDAPGAMLLLVQVIGPPAPTSGVVQTQAGGVEIDRKVSPLAGEMVAVSVRAVSGPALVTVAA